ncbi:MAG: hypothetical protein ACOYOK_09695, partial [Pseudobdellovibrionaceae bacterium]
MHNKKMTLTVLLTLALCACSIKAEIQSQLDGLTTNSSITTLQATLTNAPTGSSNIVILAVTVGGTSISKYKYKIGLSASTDCTDSAGYSSETPIANNITDDLTESA